MKANVLGLDGKKTKEIELPMVFSTSYRPDVIKRAVISAQANRRQKYGANPLAGKRTSAKYFGSRHVAPDKKMMNREMARMPREFGDTAQRFKAHFVPQAVGGRKAHPPKAEKIWTEKINVKERLLAIKSAIAATANIMLVKERNHAYDGDLPIVVDNSIHSITKTKDLVKTLESLGLKADVERASEVKIRAGKGKARGRRYKTRKGPVIIISENKGLEKLKNLPGIDIINVKRISTEDLSPGAHGARTTVWTESAIEALKERFG